MNTVYILQTHWHDGLYPVTSVHTTVDDMKRTLTVLWTESFEEFMAKRDDSKYAIHHESHYRKIYLGEREHHDQITIIIYRCKTDGTMVSDPIFCGKKDEWLQFLSLYTDDLSALKQSYTPNLKPYPKDPIGIMNDIGLGRYPYGYIHEREAIPPPVRTYLKKYSGLKRQLIKT